jgi:tRNA threonylcarbamoyladenosine biosynthesis protein TsaE
MNVAESIAQKKTVVFSEEDISQVVDYLYEQLKDCKIMVFSGPLGAGKTTLIRALLRKCGVSEPTITSPTFIYINRYKNNVGQIFYHFDLYRIESVSDFLDAGFDEYFEEPESWCFIEWPEVIMQILPEKTCYVMLDYYNDKRALRLEKSKFKEKIKLH